MILSGMVIVVIRAIIYIRYIWIPQGVEEAVAELLFIYTQTLDGIVLFLLVVSVAFTCESK